MHSKVLDTERAGKGSIDSNSGTGKELGALTLTSPSCKNLPFQYKNQNIQIQRWAIRWSLGCVNPASWLPLATGCEFTQPRAHLIVHIFTTADDDDDDNDYYCGDNVAPGSAPPSPPCNAWS